MSLQPLFHKLLAGQNLESEEAVAVMEALFHDEPPNAAKGGILALLQKKGATAMELCAFAEFIRARAVEMPRHFPDAVDTCGTGGGIPSFNLSTAAAIVGSAAGAMVAKHGNRAVTSRCGSADVLEAAGVNLAHSPNVLAECLDQTHLAFLFAHSLHPAMGAVASLRKQLPFRTVFNQLGPLANPFGARRQLLGVYDRALLRPMAEALGQLGSVHAMVVHGKDGLDEISPCGDSFIVELKNGKVNELTLTLDDFGLTALPQSALAPGASLEENLAILLQAVSEVASERALAVLPNAAATLYIAGAAETLISGVAMAREAINSGAARAKLDELIAFTEVRPS